MKIVIRAPNWIGDAVLAMPAIRCLKDNFPEAGLWIVAQERSKDLFSALDVVEGLISLPSLNDFKKLRAVASNLKKRSFDIGLLLTNSFASALLFSLSGIPQRWGYSTDGRRFLLTQGVSVKNQDLPLHQAQYYMSLLHGLKLRTRPPKLSLPVSQEARMEAAGLLASSGLIPEKPLVILSPGAFYGPAKRWPAEFFGKLAGLLRKEHEVNIAVIGAADETPLVEALGSGMREKLVDLTGKTSLRQLAGLLSQAALAVTNDSGPMHMANALEIPVVALFGPTDPKITGPLQPPSTVIQKNVACWPCSYQTCPFDHRCMTRITPDEVYAACCKYLP